jgi:lysophospholipid acyltransferase (LPLAT)-like uncharacterized protein
MKLRERLDNSDLLAAILSAVLAVYLRLCFATTRWQRQGLDDLALDLRDGPIILVLWHSRLMFGPSAWPRPLADLYTLRESSPAGRLSSETQSRLGMKPVMMTQIASNFAASRQILRLIRGGNSLGMTADGPLGPARKAKQAPLEWARATGRPVYLFAWSARRSFRLKTWDRMMIPLPFTRGVYGYRRWPVAVARKLDQSDYLRLRADLSAALDQQMHEIDRAAGVAPGP